MDPLDDHISQEFDFPSLKTARTELRILTMENTDAVFRHFSDEDVTCFMDIDACQSPDAAREIIRFHLRDSGCRWGIFERGGETLLGTCGFHAWNKSRRQAEVGYDLGRAYWGRGLMHEVLHVVIPFGFTEMSLTRISADVHPHNVRSIRVLKRLKFQPEDSTRGGLLSFHRDREAAQS